MKIKIGPYKNWFGPHQLAKALCFWASKEKDEYGFTREPNWVHNFGEWLAHGRVKPKTAVGEMTSCSHDWPETWLYRLLVWFDSVKKRRIYVKIDPWDTWNMNHTLALVILPMLRQLNKEKHGAPLVDDEDVPEHLRSTTAPEQTQEEKDCGHPDGNHFARWDWVMGEMIWTFEQELDEGAENQFSSGEFDCQWKKLDNGTSELVYGPKHTYKTDEEALRAWADRKQNGFRLFGKYYSSLWD
jgi:hypothetical protein